MQEVNRQMESSINDYEKNYLKQGILHVACQLQGMKSIIQELVTTKQLSTTTKDVFGLLPIHYAALFGYEEYIEILGESEMKSEDRESYLMYAAWGGHVSILQKYYDNHNSLYQ